MLEKTLTRKVTFSGIGLHSGREVCIELLPAAAGTGIVFIRQDLPGQPEIVPSPETLIDTKLATTIGIEFAGGVAKVQTVEHLLAALIGVEIDNVRIMVNGPEIPIMDGSAAEFVKGFFNAGIEAQNAPRSYISIKREVEVREGNRWARIRPADRLSVKGKIDFDHPLISSTPFRFNFSPKNFKKDLAGARTFGFLKDVEMLRAAGFACGANLSNAIVIDGYRILNEEGLRFGDEFIRHKILDSIGDLALFGKPVLGALEVNCAGHEINTRLVAKVLADSSCFELVQLQNRNAKSARVHSSRSREFAIEAVAISG